MNFDDYDEFEKRAEEHGIGDDPLLAQLLHIIQFKEVVKKEHRRTMDDLADWEENIAENLERRIKKAGTADDYR